MAAVIFDAFGKLCKALGDVVCLPCKACGIGCDALCDALKSPFSLFIFVNVGLNVAPIYMGLKTIPYLGGACRNDSIWLIVNATVCLIHILSAFYIIHKIQEDRRLPSPGVATQPVVGIGNASTSPAHERSSCGRVRHVLCYDMGVAMYIIILVFWFCWLVMSIPRYTSIGSKGCDEIGPHLLTSIICGFVFMSLGSCAFMCSICCL